MVTLSTIGFATGSPPLPVTAPLGPVADRPFAYVLRGLVEAQLVRSAPPVPVPDEAPARPAGIPTAAVTVGPGGPTTIGAFTLWHRVLPSRG